jgi:hypothetical protein
MFEKSNLSFFLLIDNRPWPSSTIHRKPISVLNRSDQKPLSRFLHTSYLVRQSPPSMKRLALSARKLDLRDKLAGFTPHFTCKGSVPPNAGLKEPLTATGSSSDLSPKAQPWGGSEISAVLVCYEDCERFLGRMWLNDRYVCKCSWWERLRVPC